MAATTVAMTPEFVELVGQQVGAVGKHDGYAQLDQVVVDVGNQARGDQAAGTADHHADDERQDDRHRSVEHAGRANAHRGHGDAEDDDGSAVVEQALGLDGGGQQRGSMHAPHGCQHRRRVGRGEHCADDEAELDRQAGGHVEDQAEHYRADQHPGDGQQQDQSDDPAQLAQVEPVAALEHERGQEDGKDQVRWHIDFDAGMLETPAARPTTTSATV